MPRVLIIGGGGREHALAHKFIEDENITIVHIICGNYGMYLTHSKIIPHTNIGILEFRNILNFCQLHNFSYEDLIIIGSEVPLAEGIVNYLETGSNYTLSIFGPHMYNTQLESSKVFAKSAMNYFDIPTASYEVFHSKELTRALDYITKYYPHNTSNNNLPNLPNSPNSPKFVIKLSGLHEGK